MSCDLVDVARALFKVYTLDPLVSMDRVADLWTLGGRLDGVPEVFLFAYFELHPSDPYPRPQMYFNLSTLRDGAVVDAVSAFFKKLGWMDRARRYKEDVSSYYPSCNLDESFDRLGVLSFSNTADQGPYMTTYYRRVADLL
ncbi:cyclo-L-Trp-L-Trp prenyltransferase [Aspergillus terreus]|uniref:Cyclo-L-Trp-L-Trp prenyltransferase n=1 Tax=Aspergillus terreus TaxID=33178 RepID=A0A5M3YWK1_ASPTE|nr:hypothetical protein ATETN484_0005031800 [Aspergillus terreus]GFF16983.1 cyclo-L-Trp-L-Trp prenyltransferase [Aspergillus terreus]